MPNTKTIKKNEQFSLSSGELTVKSIPGDAHITTGLIYHTIKLIKSGEGIVEGHAAAKSGEKIIIIATINLPEGSSDYASLSVEVNDENNSDRWDYSSQEPDHDEVKYEVTIAIT